MNAVNAVNSVLGRYFPNAVIRIFYTNTVARAWGQLGTQGALKLTAYIPSALMNHHYVHV